MLLVCKSVLYMSIYIYISICVCVCVARIFAYGQIWFNSSFELMSAWIYGARARG